MTDTTQGSDDTNLWTRLRRRKVVQWGIAYVAGAWGFLQGLEYVSESFHWPDHYRQIALLALVIGLPIVLVLAWYHGDRGEQHVRRPELAILTLLFLVGGGLFWWYDRTADTLTQTGEITAKPSTPTIQAVDARLSIAVLPFDNRSDEQKDAYFVDGIHDDILTQLSKISAIKVISRTSVERFRDTKLPTKEIAAQLGVESVLEGGVQRAGDRVRVTVQLIDVASDAHVWAENYDRELTTTNIFAIQSEVASAIADALQATLTPSERASVNAMPTQNLAAWEAYQLGRHRMAVRTPEAIADAIKHFEAAMQRDPSFALAYVALADTLMIQVGYGAEPVAAADRAEGLVARALELKPGLAEAAVSLAMIAWTREDYPLAESEFKRAIELNPNSADANHWYGGILRDLGRPQEALVYARRAAQLDPGTPIVTTNLGFLLINLGMYDEAATVFNKALQIDPSSPGPYIQIGWLEAYARGRIDQAIPWVQRAAELDPTGWAAPLSLSYMYFDLGDKVAANRWSDWTAPLAPDSPRNSLPCVLALQADHSVQAIKCAEASLRSDPRNSDMLAVLRDNYLRHGEAAKARALYAQAFPKLLAPEARVNADNVWAAIDLALVLKVSGDEPGAGRLLAKIEAAIRDESRLDLGLEGGIAETYIHALQDEKREALIALRKTERAGWRGPLWQLVRDHNSNLDTIRSDPEFKAIFADIERDMAKQRAALAARPKDAPLELKATGT